jgi:5-methylthioribose kinase
MTAVRYNIPESYRPLKATEIPGYLQSLPAIRERLGGGAGQWLLTEVSDGYLNLVYLVDGPNGSVCTKQSLPHVRVDENWPLPLERTLAEKLYLEIVAPYVGGAVPELYHYDPELSLIVMEKLSPHTVLRYDVIEGRRTPHAATKVADYVARTGFFTSDLFQRSEFKIANIGQFSRNHVLHRIMIELVHQDPFFPIKRNKWTSPHLDRFVDEFRSNGRLRAAAARIGYKFLNYPQALIHNDLHAGAVMTAGEDVRVIDAEFATFGPIGVDTGIFIGHLLIGYFAQAGHATAADNRHAQEEWLLDQIVEFWTTFRQRFIALWRENSGGDGYFAPIFADAVGKAVLDAEREVFLDGIFRDTAGFAATAIVRSITGYSHFLEMGSIADPDQKAASEAGALSLARAFLLHPEQFTSIASVVDAARRHRRAKQAPGTILVP